MIKLLADENIAPRVIEALRKKKFDILSIQEVRLSGVSDEKIIKFAQKEKRIILSHDKDFGKLIHQIYYKHSGVILIRLRNQSPQNVIRYLIPFLEKIKLKRIEEKLVIFQEKKIRII